MGSVANFCRAWLRLGWNSERTGRNGTEEVNEVNGSHYTRIILAFILILPSNQFVIDIRRKFVELLYSKSCELLSGRGAGIGSCYLMCELAESRRIGECQCIPRARYAAKYWLNSSKCLFDIWR